MPKTSYQQAHQPASSFDNRRQYLEHELEIMSPTRWGLNLPLRDYRFEWEDLVPAVAATIGKIVDVDLPRPRTRKALLEHPDYYRYRQDVLDFLEEYEHGAKPKAKPAKAIAAE